MPIKYKSKEKFKSDAQLSQDVWLDKLFALQGAFHDGNPLAAHEAIAICGDNSIPSPKWVADALQTVFIDFYSGKVLGKKGKGNSVLGDYMKLAKAYVRTRAYNSVRRWHKNPNNHQDMPRRLILDWFDEQSPINWFEQAVVADALRCAHVGLKETKFAGRMTTIQKARFTKVPASMKFGDYRAEIELGLRDEKGIFGAPDVSPPAHILEFLEEYNAHHPG